MLASVRGETGQEPCSLFILAFVVSCFVVVGFVGLVVLFLLGMTPGGLDSDGFKAGPDLKTV